MSQVDDEKITVSCACGKKLKAPANAVGRKAKCPGCGNVLTITKPQAPPDDLGLGMDGLYALAEDEKRAARAQPTDAAATSPRCPSCQSPMAPGAVLCVQCGFDLRTKSKVSAGRPQVIAQAGAATPPPMPGAYGFPSQVKKETPSDAMAPQGSFLAGVGLSALFAAGGGLVWFLIAYFVQYELFFIALLVGGLAGVGMQLGQKGYSTLGGVTAAGMSLLFIMLAKLAVIAAIIMPFMMDDGESWAVLEYLEEKEYVARGIDPYEASDEEIEAVEAAAEDRFHDLTEAEKQAIVAEIEAEDDADELVGYFTAENLEKLTDAQMQDIKVLEQAHSQARARYDGLTQQQRQQELARHRAIAEAELEKEMEEWEASAEGAENADSGGLGAAGTVGFLAVFFTLFIGWKSLLFIIGGMFFAYRTAAGSVHG